MRAAAKRVLPVVVFLGVLAAVSLWWKGRSGEAAEAPLEASGTVEATQADLGFQQPGRIAWIHPREGDSVGADVELAALERSELEARLAAARAQLDAADARLLELERGTRPEEIRGAAAALDGAREREEQAGAEAARARRLFEGGAISRQAFDQAETAHALARSQRVQAEQSLLIAREGPRAETIGAQRAAVAQARASVEQVEATLAQAVIRSPFAGRVTVRHREPGEVVAAGAPVLTLVDLSDRWVRIYVPENRIGRVSLGQVAEVRAGTFPERAYAGEVVFIGDVAEFTPRNVQTPEERTRLVYPVKVRITGDPALDLKPGIPADVTLPDAPGAPGGEG
jgi:HlyD family secretion protein